MPAWNRFSCANTCRFWTCGSPTFRRPWSRSFARRLPNCRIVTDFGTFGPTHVDYAREREIAEAVLDAGGLIEIAPSVDAPFEEFVGSVRPYLASREELPNDDFVVRGVQFIQTSRLDEDLFSHLPELTDLRSLYVHWVPGFEVDDRILEALLRFTTLEAVYCLGTQSHGDEIIQSLSTCQLRYIVLERVTDSGCEQLAQGQQEIRHLSLNHAFDITTAGLASVASLSQLDFLEIKQAGEKIDDSALAALSPLQQLRTFSYSPRTALAGIGVNGSGLAGLTNLHETVENLGSLRCGTEGGGPGRPVQIPRALETRINELPPARELATAPG